jgi:hypothetical protein
MAATDWQKLAQALGVGAARPSQPPAAKPAGRTRARRTTKADSGMLRCPKGHALPSGDFLCYCPECLAQGKRTALFGWQAAPCGHRIPGRSRFCPDCGAPTGW